MISALFKTHSRKIPAYLFGIGILVYCLFFFPGKLSDDSKNIYTQVLAHSYSDHHPPLMGYVWHYLNLLVPGPALMFMVNMFLIWGSAYILAFRIFPGQFMAYGVMFLPFMPQILIYAGWIWKDLIFSYGYILISLFLAERSVNNQPIKIWHIPCLFLLLFYATAVKFQAQFILPVILFWFFQVFGKQHTWRYKKIISVLGTILAWLIIMTSIEHTNNFITHTRGNGTDHSWQYVKIFDLAGMTVRKKEMLLPSEIFTRPNVTVADIEDKWDLLWEPLITSENPPLRATKTDAERDILLQTWWHHVLNNPLVYLEHRISIWYEGIIGAAPSKNYIEKNLFFDNALIKNILLMIASLFAYIVIFPLHLGFLLLGYLTLRRTHGDNGYAQSLIMITVMGLLLVVILLFKSLAATPRYICFTFGTFYFALPFALKCLHLLQRPKTDQKIS